MAAIGSLMWGDLEGFEGDNDQGLLTLGMRTTQMWWPSLMAAVACWTCWTRTIQQLFIEDFNVTTDMTEMVKKLQLPAVGSVGLLYFRWYTIFDAPLRSHTESCQAKEIRYGRM